MNNVYVAPYGEDPFEFLEILNRHFHLKDIYSLREISYPDILHTPFALEYERRMDFDLYIHKNNGNNHLDNYWVKFEDGGARCFAEL
ncbi:MAG: hypothetical protein K6G24_04350 [Lachnospiraceae bacterium]|nr:hypothetical protein [Lachnospiraceae bacterium]